jgi:excisionase family DNA binding protein
MSANLLSVKAAAERLDASPMTVYRLVYAGRLVPHYIGLGSKPRVRIAESDLDAYIDSTRAGGPPAGPGSPPPPPGPKPGPRPKERAA